MHLHTTCKAPADRFLSTALAAPCTCTEPAQPACADDLQGTCAAPAQHLRSATLVELVGHNGSGI